MASSAARSVRTTATRVIRASTDQSIGPSSRTSAPSKWALPGSSGPSSSSAPGKWGLQGNVTDATGKPLRRPPSVHPKWGQPSRSTYPEIVTRTPGSSSSRSSASPLNGNRRVGDWGRSNRDSEQSYTREENSQIRDDELRRLPNDLALSPTPESRQSWRDRSQRPPPSLSKWTADQNSEETTLRPTTSLNSTNNLNRNAIFSDPFVQSDAAETSWTADRGDEHIFRQKKVHKGVGNILDKTWEDEPNQAAPPIRFQKPKHKPKLVPMNRIEEDVFIPTMISVVNLARLLNIRQKRLQDRMIRVGMTTVDYNHLLDADNASLLALEFGRNPVIDDEAAFDLYPSLPKDMTNLPSRPPVITIMGHVDHGKTTLLDTLRSTSVASSEAGGITQHIGAFSVPVPSLSTSTPTIPNSKTRDSRTITFLDTPGHAAFTAMRARGAGMTDIIVLVVAADDGVMPQTKEVIELAKKDPNNPDKGVELVVAINKCDKPGVDVTQIKHSLLAEGVQLEEFGGDVPAVEVSGLTGMGLDKLVETISALAEIKELRARNTGRMEGRILESRVDKGKGATATILVLQGELSAGSFVVAGTTWTRARQMTDSTGRTVKSATAGTPVTIAGWKDLPQAGDEVLGGSESEVKKAVHNRIRNLKQVAMIADVESMNEKRLELKEAEEAGASGATAGDRKSDDVKELRLIIKGDVSGTVEAVVGALEGIGNHVAKVKIVQSHVGDVSESDVTLAQATNSTVIGFSVKATSKIIQQAEAIGVPLLLGTVIYRLMDEVKQRVQALLPPVIENRVSGEAIVQQIFEIKGKGRSILHVAGCRVTNGLIERNKRVRVMRNGEEIYNGTFDSLKHVKKEVTEARKGSECGLALVKFSDIKEGDRVQCFEAIETPGQL